MKKRIFTLFFIFLTLQLFSQTHTTVDLGNDIYSLLSACEQKNYCERLSNVKPYTESYILKILKQSREHILENLEKEDSYTNRTELKTIDFYISQYEHKNKLDFSRLSFRYQSKNEKFPISFEFSNYDEGFISSGFYNLSDINSTGFEIFHNFNFVGDFGKNLSYRATAFLGLTEMPLQQVGNDYLIGYWWYDDWDSSTNGVGNRKRTINTFRNNSVLPYSYKKKWDGSVYYLTNLNHSGLEGWPTQLALGFGMYGEIRASLFDERISIGFGRYNHEWAAMDDNSSLVLNANASPFLGFDIKIDLFKWLSFSTLTGVMEFPNARYINGNAWYYCDFDAEPTIDEETGEKIYPNNFTAVDSYFFQNLYSLGMIDLNFKYVHMDFGSAVIWPKRFELGYMFPLINHVVYQNSVGDFDNLSLFGDIKGIIPGIGSIWFSAYIEEIDALKTNLFEKTRCMFAYQLGSKVNIPFLPFTTLSFRYTKIEPYCYTHQAIRKQPWYEFYIAESYTNNGKSLGYYLEPNSDEFFVRIESRPLPSAIVGLQYQLIRHGADYGSGAVPGSSIWSEMSTGNRDSLKKYFLHDGTYEWTHSITLDASYTFKDFVIPLQLYGGIGYVYDYFTKSEGGPNQKTPYHKINTSEYPTKHGCVMYIGFKVFGFERSH